MKYKGIAATSTVTADRTEIPPLSYFDEMKKQSKGTCDVVVDSKSNVTLVRCKENKVVTVSSTVFGKESMKEAKHFIKDRVGSVQINETNSIVVYYRTLRGVDQIDQNIGAYVINFCSKKWW